VTGYKKIKQLAKMRHCTIPDILVLARQNDPFFAGSETGQAMARWFAALWHQFSYTTGVHLRRVHYELVSQEQAGRHKHNGEPYENTENDWNYLSHAGKHARYLGLIDAEAFVDRRNPEPHLFAASQTMAAPFWQYPVPGWALPRIESNLLPALD
jgi:hypothetical protein